MASFTVKFASGLMAAVVLASTAAPAEARRWRHHRDDGVDVGDVIGAAVVIGGIAALISAASKSDDGYGGTYGAERRAVDACVREAETSASRYDVARVGDITDVVRERGGYYRVSGYLNVAGEGPSAERDGFTCTARGSRIFDFQRSSGVHW